MKCERRLCWAGVHAGPAAGEVCIPVDAPKMLRRLRPVDALHTLAVIPRNAS